MKPRSKSNSPSRTRVTSKPSTAPKRTTARRSGARSAAKASPAADATRPVTFRYFAPQAASVLVAGDFTRWQDAPVRLEKEVDGNWKTTLDLKPGRYQYRLLVDGEWQNDPACPELLPNEFGSANCVVWIG